jgi:hypothetical protein
MARGTVYPIENSKVKRYKEGRGREKGIKEFIIRKIIKKPIIKDQAK